MVQVPIHLRDWGVDLTLNEGRVPRSRPDFGFDFNKILHIPPEFEEMVKW